MRELSGYLSKTVLLVFPGVAFLASSEGKAFTGLLSTVYWTPCESSTVVVHQPSKLTTRVRFPSLAQQRKNSPRQGSFLFFDPH